MQPYPRSPDLVWPGHLHGTGCLSARALDTGFPTVVWCLCLGPGCGWVWVSVIPPVLAGVSGGCVRVRSVVSSLFCRLGFVVFAVWPGFGPAARLSWFRVWDCVAACALCLHPAVPGSGVRCGRACWGLGFSCAPPLLGGVLGCVCAPVPLPFGLPQLPVGGAVRGCVVGAAPPNSWLGRQGACVFVHAPRLFPAFPGWGVLCGRACCARVSVVPRSSWLGCQGVFLFCQGLSCFGFVASVAGCPCPGRCGPCPPIPSLSGWVAGFFFPVPAWCVSARFGCPFPRGSLLLVWCCRFLLGGPPVPLWGVLSSVPSEWGVWLPLAVLVGGLVPVGRSLAPPPPQFFFWGGVCLFLPLPSLGWRTHWPAFSVVPRVAVGGCVVLGRLPAPWVGWVMYTLGWAPLLAGLGPGSTCPASAPGGFVWLWVRGGWGCPCPVASAVAVSTFRVDRHRCCRARGGFVCGPLCQCVARWCGAFRAVWWLVLVCPSGWSQPCRVVLLCAASRRVVLWRVALCGALLWCVALLRAAVRCAVLPRVVPWWVGGGQPGLCLGAECGSEFGWLVAGGCG